MKGETLDERIIRLERDYNWAQGNLGMREQWKIFNELQNAREARDAREAKNNRNRPR